MLFFDKLFGRGMPSAIPEISDRAESDVSRGMIPEKLDAIMRAANSGDTEDQCRLCNEILEKDAEIAQAVSTRTAAVVGAGWHIEPGTQDPAAQRAADALRKELESIDGGNDNFDELIEWLETAILPGFAVAEILWRAGGSIAGFHPIEQQYFSFTDGFDPLLITSDRPEGIAIPRERIVCHRFRAHGTDAARGGLIRPLAWMYCFANLNEKNLLSFVERYGMPFLIVKADEETYKKERNNLKRLIRNFGSCGGGIFTRNVEHELLQAANTDGNVYFRLKDYYQAAVNRLVLGQTASSGDGGGLSGDNAQDKVRRDILKSDCRRIMRTVGAQICVPWCEYNFGPEVPAPKLVMECDPPEDKLQIAQTLQALAGAGLEPDPEEMSKRFGFTLRKREMAAPAGQFGQVGQSETPAEDPDVAHNLNLKQKYDAMGVAIRAGLLTATPEIEAQTRSELGLPAMTPEVRKAWDATGGIRQPITLKSAEAEAVTDALNVDEQAKPDASAMAAELAETPDKSDKKKDEPTLADALNEWLGPLAVNPDDLEWDGLSDAEVRARLRHIQEKAQAGTGHSKVMENLMQKEMESKYGSQDDGQRPGDA